VNALGTPLRDADHALAAREDALPCLAVLLDDDRLSGLLGEAVHVTRVRYKPGTSALVAFVRTRGSTEEYGWALTRAGSVKLQGRAESSERHGGGMHLIRPARHDSDAMIAVGGMEDDWALRKNLRWLGDRGLQRLGAEQGPGPGLFSGTARVLRYKPERRLVLLEQTASGPIVIKTAALAAPGTAGRFHERLQQHGVPVPPLLGDASCFRHGTTASAEWGDGDLTASADPGAPRRAGEALARVHGIPAEAGPGPGPGPAPETLVERQLAATCAMVTALVPALEEPAAQAAARIRHAIHASRPAGVRTGRTMVLIHGDFSADQVLVNGAEVRLIDFDRSRAGAPEADLGSFAAVEEMSQRRGHTGAAPGLQTGHLIEGYAQAGGQFDPATVDAWTALRMFTSSVDPFRDRTQDWAAAMDRQIDRAVELAR
jgi:aminoglycoside phosphotransferase (APT) family kinase protein